MEHINNAKDIEILYVIVNSGLGSKVLHLSKQHGVTGGSIMLGKGTNCNRFLELLALCDIRKEIVMMITKKNIGTKVLQTLNKELKLGKPNRGIAFSMPVVGVCGSSSCNCDDTKNVEEDEKTMYRSIMTIVDKGKGEDVVDAAEKAGSKGATIINARGSGIHETSKLFSMEIEPEKEMVLIIANEKKAREIVDSIRVNFEIDKPGNGIIFVQNIKEVYGLYE